MFEWIDLVFKRTDRMNIARWKLAMTVPKNAC